MNDTHQTPEQRARGRIDQLLRDAGWQVQDMNDFNRNAALGVAVREFQLPSGPCDYLLFIDGKAALELEFEKAANLGSARKVEMVRSVSLRRSILKFAFTGQLVDQHLNDEPVSELLTRLKNS